jgi:formylglycine-generating enzyme required for sulfatase activity
MSFRAVALPVLALMIPAAGCRTPERAAGHAPASVVAPFNGQQARAAQESWASHLGVQVFVTNSMALAFALIPPGEFVMGSPESEARRQPEENQHPVRITHPFYMGAFAVTQGEFEKLMGGNPSYWSAWGYRQKRGKDMDTSRFPVERVSWFDAELFCRKISELPAEKAAGRVYRLATEAEWEYACRAGTANVFHFGDVLDGTQANVCGGHPYGTDKKGPYLNRPTNVGSYPGNAFGLFDMHGNMWEWCADWCDSGYYTNSPVNDPTGPADGEARVIRGGAWRFSADWCRAAARYGYDPRIRAYDVGFRVAMDVPRGGRE